MKNKKVVRLTESQLHNIIAEAVGKILNEIETKTIENAYVASHPGSRMLDMRNFSPAQKRLINKAYEEYVNNGIPDNEAKMLALKYCQERQMEVFGLELGKRNATYNPETGVFSYVKADSDGKVEPMHGNFKDASFYDSPSDIPRNGIFNTKDRKDAKKIKKKAKELNKRLENPKVAAAMFDHILGSVKK